MTLYPSRWTDVTEEELKHFMPNRFAVNPDDELICCQSAPSAAASSEGL